MFLEISKRALLSQALDLSGCGRILRAGRVWQGVLILNYHRIGQADQSLLDRNLWSATPGDFDRQVAIAKRNFDVIGLEDVEHALQERRGRHVMFTFDDGYRDNYTDAFPILKSHGAPATFFISTGFLDNPKVPWWDEIAWMVRTSPLTTLPENPWTSTAIQFSDEFREASIRRLLSVYKRLPGEKTPHYLEFLAEALQTGRCPERVADDLWMTWDMVREMRTGGMTFGGHTVTHPVLSNLTPEQQDWEVGECKRRLMEELGEKIYAFSYPVGGRNAFNTHTRRALTKHGFPLGFVYYGMHCRPGHEDLHAINRTAIETDVDLPQFQAMLTLPQVFA